MSSHFKSLFACVFSLARCFARLFSLGIWLFCGACLWPWVRLFSLLLTICATLASMAFSRLFGSDPLLGLAPGGVAFWVCCLRWVLPPLLALWLAVPYLCVSAPSVCIVRWLVSGVSFGLLALPRVCSLHMDWVFPFLFSQASFVVFFPWPDSLALLCLFEVPIGAFVIPCGPPPLAGVCPWVLGYPLSLGSRFRVS